ncbi:hypothetical protein V5J35_000070 [Endozoicomonas sp. NE40]|uniref:Uncharacterized protein n=1 Tax=Endozoicomonas lisbonensis TaxID=3120522 RepID=A0ABV2SAT6_9GAMM
MTDITEELWHMLDARSLMSEKAKNNAPSPALTEAH